MELKESDPVDIDPSFRSVSKVAYSSRNFITFRKTETPLKMITEIVVNVALLP